MSRINGEKARAAIARKRRTAQREGDRIRRAQLTETANAAAAAKEAPAAQKSAKK
jgi:hypothetical protein